MDATDVRVLRLQNMQDMDAVVVAIGEDFEALMLCVVQLMELRVKRIMARANGKHQRQNPGKDWCGRKFFLPKMMLVLL